MRLWKCPVCEVKTIRKMGEDFRLCPECGKKMMPIVQEDNGKEISLKRLEE